MSSPQTTNSQSLFDLQTALEPLRDRSVEVSRALYEHIQMAANDREMGAVFFPAQPAVQHALRKFYMTGSLCKPAMELLKKMKMTGKPESEIPVSQQAEIREDFLNYRKSICRLMEEITHAIPGRESLHTHAKRLLADASAEVQPATPVNLPVNPPPLHNSGPRP